MQTGKVMAIATITTTTLGAAGIVVIAVEGTRITSGAHSANAEIATTKATKKRPLLADLCHQSKPFRRLS